MSENGNLENLVFKPKNAMVVSLQRNVSWILPLLLNVSVNLLQHLPLLWLC